MQNGQVLSPQLQNLYINCRYLNSTVNIRLISTIKAALPQERPEDLLVFEEEDSIEQWDPLSGLLGRGDGDIQQQQADLPIIMAAYKRFQDQRGSHRLLLDERRQRADCLESVEVLVIG